MDSNKLKQYNSAKAEIPRLQKEIAAMPDYIEGVSVVKSSLSKHPFTQGHYTQRGFEPNPQKAKAEARLQKLEALVGEVDDFMLTTDDLYILRAIRLHYIEGLRWDDVPREMGTYCSGDSLRKQAEKILKKS